MRSPDCKGREPGERLIVGRGPGRKRQLEDAERGPAELERRHCRIRSNRERGGRAAAENGGRYFGAGARGAVGTVNGDELDLPRPLAPESRRAGAPPASASASAAAMLPGATGPRTRSASAAWAAARAAYAYSRSVNGPAVRRSSRVPSAGPPFSSGSCRTGVALARAASRASDAGASASPTTSWPGRSAAGRLEPASRAARAGDWADTAWAVARPAP